MVEQKFHVNFRCIIVTGKGYPDFATRLLVKEIQSLEIPILGLFDSDPHGLEILTSYAVGSMVKLSIFSF